MVIELHMQDRPRTGGGCHTDGGLPMDFKGLAIREMLRSPPSPAAWRLDKGCACNANISRCSPAGAGKTPARSTARGMHWRHPWCSCLGVVHPIPLNGPLAPVLVNGLGEVSADDLGTSLTPLRGLPADHQAFQRAIAVMAGRIMYPLNRFPAAGVPTELLRHPFQTGLFRKGIAPCRAPALAMAAVRRV